MKGVSRYGMPKRSERKLNCLCHSYAKSETILGACAAESKLTLILLLSKTLFLAVATVSEGAIRDDPIKRSALRVQCNME